MGISVVPHGKPLLLELLEYFVSPGFIICMGFV